MDLDNFICPETGAPLRREGNLLVGGPRALPIIRDIPRFVASEDYAEPFGLQWKIFRRTQLDSYTGTRITEERLRQALGFDLAKLAGKRVLEVGSGAGRFTEVLLKYGALVYSFDLSTAVDANFENNIPNDRLTLFQADIRHIPFASDWFDLVICLGVLQHTPSKQESLNELTRVLKPGGIVATDHYKWHPGIFTTLYLAWWAVIKRLPPPRQLKVTDWLTDVFFPIHWSLRKSGLAQVLLRRVSPINFYYSEFDLPKELLREWSRLDTHDRNTDHFKHHVRRKQYVRLLEESGLSEVEVFVGGTGYVGRGRKMKPAVRSRTILLVNEHLAGGGAERQLTQLANSLAEAGDRVILATWASPKIPDAYPLSSQVERFHLRRGEPRGGKVGRTFVTAVSWFKLACLIRRSRSDIVISFSEVSNILSSWATKLLGLPIIVSIRVDPEGIFQMKPHWRNPAIAAYRRADTVVVQTRGVADWCRRECGREATIIVNMLRQGLPAVPSMRERQPIVVSVGSLTPRKAHDVLIRAFAKTHPRHPSWTLLLLGQGPEQASLVTLAANLGISHRVAIPGFTSDVEGALARASIFVMASRSEGFPNALIEAMAMGTAAISTDCDHGPREIIASGKNGVLVPVDDVDALAAVLYRLMEDGSMRDALASEAVTIRDMCDATAVFSAWDQAIDATIRGKGAA